MNQKSKRKHNTELPTIKELASILAAESHRPVVAGKESTHYPNFESIIKWLSHLGLSTKFFDQDLPTSELDRHSAVEDIKGLVDQMVKAMLDQNVVNNSSKIIYDDVYSYLSEEDKLKKADLIFVFGSKTPVRIEKAIEIYNQGWANKIMISGGNPFYDSSNSLSEAERYQQLAVENGVPFRNIITEHNSITIPDNVRSSLNLLDQKEFNLGSIILVNSPYTQRRGWAHFKKYLPESVDIVRVNSATIEKYQKNNWYRNEDGIRTFANEFVKMKVAVTLNTA
jgi:uncharacterized SAM-binding protein YcdF (DUF218 family)